MTISTQRLRFLRGNTAAASAFTGLGGELIVDTTLNTIRVQDGSTPGGTLLATAAQLSNVSISQLTNGSYTLLLDSNGDAVIPGNLVSANTALTSYMDLHKNGLGGVEVGAYTDFTLLTSLSGANNEWHFDTYGNLTIPGNINYANGVNILSGITANGGGNYSNVNVAAYLPIYNGNIGIGNITNNTADLTLSVGVSNWIFDETGVLTAPGEIETPGNISAGYVSANYFIGNGALLTGIVASSNYGNANVAAYLVDNPPPGTYSNANVASYLPTYTGNIAANIVKNNNTWNFEANGVLTLPANGGIRGLPGVYSTALSQIGGCVYVSSSSTNDAYYSQLMLGYYDGVTAYVKGLPGVVYTYTLGADGNLRYPDGTLYSGSNITVRSGTGNVFNWKFSDPSIGSETITLDWNLLGTKNFGQWYLATNDTAKYWLLDSDTKQLSFSNAGAVDGGGKLTFGTAANSGAGNINDIELTSTNSNVYVRANSNSWKFGNDGVLAFPGGSLSMGQGMGNFIQSTDNLFINSSLLTISAAPDGQNLSQINMDGYGNINIRSIKDNATEYYWLFESNAATVFPGNITTSITSSPAPTITGFDINSGNVTAYTGNFTNLYGQLLTAAQPGITSLGSLTGLSVGGTINTTTLQVDGNATIGNLLVTGTSTIIGNINMISGNSGQFFGNSPTGFNALYTGIAAGYTPLQQTIIQSSGNYNDYVQNNLENVNSGNAATGDYVVTADNGTDTSYYIDMGIAGSNFDGLSPNIVGNSVRANDAYLYTLGNGAGNQGGNLIIGAGTEGKVVKIIAGGGHTHDVIAQVSSSLLQVFGSTTANGNVTTGSYFIGNGSQLTGVNAVTATYVTGLTSANVTTALGFVPANSNAASNYGNANVAAYLPTYTGNLSAANISLTNNTSALTFNTGAYIYGDTSGRPGSVVLQPNTSVAGFPSVIIGGAGRLAAPNGSVHAIFNTADLTVQVPLKATSATAATSTSTGALTVSGGAGVAGNVYAGGAIVATGNITGNYFIGNGALLTGITASSNYGNTNVTAFLGAYGSNTIVTTGNISAGYFVGNGSLLTGIVASGSTYANSNVAAYLASNSAVPITTTSNITAAYYIGNGSLLTGIVANTTYSNTNVASYLTGNIVVGNISGNEPNVTLVANTYSYVFSNIGNVSFPGNLSVTSNVSGSYFIGNGALLTGIVASGSNYGDSNVATFLGAYGSNTIVTTGNVSAGYFIGNGALLTGIVASGSSYGNANVANYLASNSAVPIVTTSNITAGYFIGNGALLTGMASSFGNANVAAYLNNGFSVTNGPINFTASPPAYSSPGIQWSNGFQSEKYGNTEVAAFLANIGSNAIVTTGNVSAGYFIGNGALLTGIAASSNYGDSNVTSLLSSYGSNTVVTTGNISAGYFIGDGSLLTGITATANYNNSNVASFLSNIGSNAISTTGNITAGYFVGDGSLLTGITATANYNDSNVAALLASFGTNAISTTGNITAGNLSISGNIVDTGALSILSGSNGNISLITNGTGIVRAPGSLTAFGNIVTAYATQANASTLFIGNNTTISAGGASASSTYVMNNAYYNTAGVLTARNTLAAGAGQFEIAGGTFNWNAVSTATANTAAGMGVRMSLSSSGLATQNSIGITSAGTLTVQGASGLVTTQTTGALFNTTATTINLGGVATTINMGAATTVVNVGSNTGNISVGNISTNTNITVNNTITTGTLALAAAGTGNISGVGNLVGITSNTTITAGTYVTSFLSNGAITTTSNVIVTGSNAISVPNLPAFRVYGNTSTNFTAGTTLSNQVIDYNQGSYYNNSTGFFTAPVAGLYHCYATVRVANNNALNQAGLQKNSSQTGANVIAFWETDTNTGTAMHFAMTGYAKCVVGDTIRLQVISGNINFDTNDSWGVTFIG